VDVADIAFVVHIGRPHSLIDFVQEVGRGGRGGEKVQSVVVVEDKEIRWLATENAKSTDRSKEAMRQFLVSSTCQRVQLGTFLDSKGQLYNASCGEVCDVCDRRQVEKGDLVVRNTDTQKRWERGPQLWQQRVREQGLERQKLEQARIEIGDSCAICWVVQRDKGQEHKEGDCDLVKKVLGQAYGWLRRSIRFDTNSCCYTCSLPGDTMSLNCTTGVGLGCPQGRKWWLPLGAKNGLPQAGKAGGA
jgi:superfamily II DNA/RNA helicase